MEAGLNVITMSFNNDARIVRDETKPLSRRYLALRHCVENHCPLGFNATWRVLETKFGIREGQETTSPVLLAAIEFLQADRQAWLKLSRAHQELVHLRRSNGFPLPKLVEKNSRT